MKTNKDNADIHASSTDNSIIINRFEQSACKHSPTQLQGKIRAADNSTASKKAFAIGGVSCFEDSFGVAESSVLRINICAEKPAHRKSAKR